MKLVKGSDEKKIDFELEMEVVEELEKPAFQALKNKLLETFGGQNETKQAFVNVLALPSKTEVAHALAHKKRIVEFLESLGDEASLGMQDFTLILDFALGLRLSGRARCESASARDEFVSASARDEFVSQARIVADQLMAYSDGGDSRGGCIDSWRERARVIESGCATLERGLRILRCKRCHFCDTTCRPPATHRETPNCQINPLVAVRLVATRALSQVFARVLDLAAPTLVLPFVVYLTTALENARHGRLIQPATCEDEHGFATLPRVIAWMDRHMPQFLAARTMLIELHHHSQLYDKGKLMLPVRTLLQKVDWTNPTPQALNWLQIVASSP